MVAKPEGAGIFEDANIAILCGTTSLSKFSDLIFNGLWSSAIYYNAGATISPQTGDALGNRLLLYGMAAVAAGVFGLVYAVHQRVFDQRLQHETWHPVFIRLAGGLYDKLRAFRITELLDGNITIINIHLLRRGKVRLVGKRCAQPLAEPPRSSGWRRRCVSP